MTMPVALIATENTPSARASAIADATASSSLLSPATAVTRLPSSATERRGAVGVGIEHDGTHPY